MELEDSDYHVEEEENDFYDSNHDASDASDAMDNDIHHLDDDLLENPNHNNEDFGAFEQNIFKFESNEDNGRYDEDVIPIARFMDGNGFFSSKNILWGNDAHEEITGMNGTIVDNDGDPKQDELIPILESPSNVLAQVEENDKPNEATRCEVNVEMNAGNKSVESIGVLANKTSEEPSIQNNNTHEVRRNVYPSFMGFERPNPVHSSKGKKHLMQNPHLPPHSSGSTPSHTLFTTSNTTLNGSRSSHQMRFSRQPLHIAKEKPSSTNQIFCSIM